MKGYKGFSKGLVCKGKQYAENTVFEEDNAEICKSGMHFCTNPFEVLDFYGFVDDSANLNEFAEVESLDETKTDDDKKFTTKKLKIGRKIGITGLVDAFVEYTTNNTDFKNTKTINSGYRSASVNSGDWSASVNSGDWSASVNSGYRSASVNSGDRSASVNSGKRSASVNSGDRSASVNSGNRSASVNSGDWSASVNSGDRSASVNSGYRSAASVEGNGSVAVVTGYQSKAKASIGSAIVICERGDWDGKTYPLLSIKSAIIDGTRYKPDTWYTVRNGRIVKSDK